MLSYVFVFMIAVSIICSFFVGSGEALTGAMMDGASSAVELIIMMSGMMCLWGGVMKVAEKSGLTEKLCVICSPLLSRLFPQVDKKSDAFSYICMNFSANLLGLSNAATPLGICAMKELDKGNTGDTLSDSQIVFVVMNTASLQLLPTTLATLRSVYGSEAPFEITVPVWVSSFCALLVGLFFAKFFCSVRKNSPKSLIQTRLSNHRKAHTL